VPNKLAHFAIEADDVERARAFYSAAFNWQFEPWGPPEFYLIHEAGLHGALQKRAGPSTPGRHGFECSIAVDDLRASMDKIKAAGGTLLGAPHTIPTVGELTQFTDTEGNRAVIIQYEPEAKIALGL
jgi:predicted enzyme related to lactoylglutathione lyase